jgi:hypothetical protein
VNLFSGAGVIALLLPGKPAMLSTTGMARLAGRID